MEQYFTFVNSHLALFMALFVVMGLLVHNLMLGRQGSVDPTKATDLINHQDAVVVDVRAAADFAQGHILNAVNIPVNGLGQQLAILEKHKDQPVIVSCRSGAQSQLACRTLRKAGFTQVFNLQGGILAWQNANLPLTRKKTK